MSRVVHIVSYCDLCAKGGEQVPASGVVTAAISDGERLTASARFVDVCDDHGGQLKALAQLLLERGALPSDGAAGRVGRPARAHADPAACPICGHTRASGNLAEHVWQAHLHEPRHTGTTCPECGKECGSTTSMGSHRRRAHGYDALAYAVELYRARNPRTQRTEDGS